MNKIKSGLINIPIKLKSNIFFKLFSNTDNITSTKNNSTNNTEKPKIDDQRMKSLSEVQILK